MPDITVQECQLVSRDQNGSVVYRAQFALNRGLPLEGGSTNVDPLNILLGGRFLGFLPRLRADEYERRHRGLAADTAILHQFYSEDNPTLTTGINGQLFGDQYALYNQISPLAGNYCIRLEKATNHGTMQLRPINHDVRNGGIHGEFRLVFFVYLVFSYPIDDWRDCYYMKTGVTVDKSVPFSLRASSDQMEQVQLESELLTVDNETLIGDPEAEFVQPDLMQDVFVLHNMNAQHDVAMGINFHNDDTLNF